MFLLKLKLLKLIGVLLILPVISIQFSGFFKEVGSGVSHMFRMVTLEGNASSWHKPDLDLKLTFDAPFRPAMAMPGHWHSGGQDALRVHYRVYAMSGRMIFEQRTSLMTSGWVWAEWSGKTLEGDWAKRGSYRYTVSYYNKKGTVTHQGEFKKSW